MSGKEKKPQEKLLEKIKNPKHKMFAFEYANNGQNATRAYKKAYPTVKRSTAIANGHKLLTRTDISEALKEYFADFYESRKNLTGETLKVLEKILKSDISDVMEYKNGEMTILDFDEIADPSVIHSIDHTRTETEMTVNVKKSVKMYDKVKVADQIARITNMIADKADFAGTIEIIPAKIPQRLLDKMKKDEKKKE